MNYSKLINSLTAEMKKGVQYARLPKLVKIFMIVAVAPLIVSFVVSKFIYWVTLFFFKMISSPAEQLHNWIRKQKDELQHATQAVLYFVCLPAVFGLQLLLSFSALAFFFQWFLLMVQGYVLTLGGIKWQPFITEASFDEEQTQYVCKPEVNVAAIYAYVTAGALLLYILIYFISGIVKDSLMDEFSKGLFEFYKVLGSVNGAVSKIYLILLFIVNPILFKKVAE